MIFTEATGVRRRTLGAEFPQTIAALTTVTGGKPSASICHDSPASLEAKSFPLRVPK
jgi:hypothetical protein